MSQMSKSSHRSRSFQPCPSSLGCPYSHRSPTDDHELYPDDSNSMVSSNRSSHRSGGSASHISRSSHHSRTSHRESSLRKEMFERASLGPIREDYEESHHSRCSHSSGGRNSRALIRRDEDQHEDILSHNSRSSRRRASNRDRDIDEMCSQLSRASLSAADQNKALWAKQSQARSRSAADHDDAFHDTGSRISRRSSHHSASGPGSSYQRDDWTMRRQRTTRSRSLSHEQKQEQVSHAESMARGRDRALSRYERSALDQEDRQRYRNNPPHTLGTGDLRMSESMMSYRSGLDTRHFKAGDEVDVKSRMNIDRTADGAYSIHDEMDIKMRFGAGVVPGGGVGVGMSGLRGGSGGEDIVDDVQDSSGSAATSGDESAERERYDSAPDRLDSGCRYGIHCTNNKYTCPVHHPPYGIMGQGYRWVRRYWWGLSTDAGLGGADADPNC